MYVAISDLRESLVRWRLWMLLGWLEIRQRYARSRLGPFWLTVSTCVMVTSIGLVYGTLFGQDMHDYLPFLAVSLVFWTMFSSVINEGAQAYINSATYIRQIRTPRLVFVLQVLWRNIIILGHNFIIVLALLAIFGVRDYRALPLIVPGFLLFVLNATWIAMLAALISARFRDLPQIIAALLQVAFYVTPIIYRPTSLNRFAWIVEFNPLAYMIELVRGPLIGVFPSLLTWIVSAGMAVIGWLVALFFTGRYEKRIPYWV
ncbi:ABC transporter permease [Caballeronia sp. GAWG1-1]|uniref:ABC transporter permease n=1 Tax=Caballeronia sp. GAWG1-1 TaxID=2921742 RepID=UPI0020281431|nr:ABC transporter permease [Caballeronia sp. GAWG1-1]